MHFGGILIFGINAKYAGNARRTIHNINNTWNKAKQSNAMAEKAKLFSFVYSGDCVFAFLSVSRRYLCGWAPLMQSREIN